MHSGGMNRRQLLLAGAGAAVGGLALRPDAAEAAVVFEAEGGAAGVGVAGKVERIRFTRLTLGAAARPPTIIDPEKDLRQPDLSSATASSDMTESSDTVAVDPTQPPSEFRVSVEVVVTEESELWRGATLLTTTSGYSLGDELVAFGGWQPTEGGATEFVAEAVESTYHAIEDKFVQARSGDVLTTSAGYIVLAAETQPFAAPPRLQAKALSDIVPGDRISTLAWRDAARSKFVAANIGVVVA